MDIVRITLMGSGFDVVRGIVAKKEYNKIKNSLDNVWIIDLNKKNKVMKKYILTLTPHLFLQLCYLEQLGILFV